MPNPDPSLKGRGYPLRLFYFSLYVKDHLRFALLPNFHLAFIVRRNFTPYFLPFHTMLTRKKQQV